MAGVFIGSGFSGIWLAGCEDGGLNALVWFTVDFKASSEQLESLTKANKSEAGARTADFHIAGGTDAHSLVLHADAKGSGIVGNNFDKCFHDIGMFNDIEKKFLYGKENKNAHVFMRSIEG
jgi:hypothetical protein